MAAITGKGGSIVISSTTYCVENWNLNITNELQEVVTTCSDGWAEYIAGIKSAELTASIFFDPVTDQIDTFLPDATALATTLNVGASSPQHAFTGTFVASNMTVENPAKTVVKVNVTAKLTGALTYI